MPELKNNVVPPPPPALLFLKTLTIKQAALILVAAIFAYVVYSGIQGYFQQSLGLGGQFERSGVSNTLAPAQGGMEYGMPPSGSAYAIRDSYGGDAVADDAKGYTGIIPPDPAPTAAVAGAVKMIRSASLALLVADTDEAARGIDAIRARYGGYPGGSSFAEYTKGIREGSMTIWVPSERLDAALADIRTLAIRVRSENVSATDVSRQFMDLEARLRNAKANEVRYLDILDRSGTITEVLNVTQYINSTRAEIEMLQGQMDELSGRVAYSSIMVSIVPEASPRAAASEWRPLGIAKEALANAIADLKSFAALLIAGIIGLIALVPMLAFYALVLWLLWKFAQWAYRRATGSSLRLPGRGI